MQKMAVSVALFALGTGQGAPAPTHCAPNQRRNNAVQYVKDVNAAEAAAFFNLKSYQQLEQLPIRPLPRDYTVQLSTDGETYALVVKDTTDACRGAVFSDQKGVIYTGLPIDQLGR